MIKLHENFKANYNTVVDNLKAYLDAYLQDDDKDTVANEVASILLGVQSSDVTQEDVDYISKYQKENLKNRYKTMF